MLGSPRVKSASISLKQFQRSFDTSHKSSAAATASASMAATAADGATAAAGSNEGAPMLRIVTYNNTAENVYVQKLLVNGVEHRQAFISRSELASPSGCLLEFFMGSAPTSALCPAQ